MDQTDYAKLIEIPTSSCEIIYKRPRRFTVKRAEGLKNRLIKNVNGDGTEDAQSAQALPEVTEMQEADSASGYMTADGLMADDADEYSALDDFVQGDYTSPSVEIIPATAPQSQASDEEGVKKHRHARRRLAFDIVAAQVAVIAVLALTILLTSIFWADSGISTLVSNVFAGGEELPEDVAYTQFSASAPVRTDSIALEEGVMTVSKEGSIYPVCDGKITNVAENAGKLDIYIEYSPSFTAVISGATYAYYAPGDSVYSTLPVCYSSEQSTKIYLYSNGKLLTDYVIDNGKIIWQS